MHASPLGMRTGQTVTARLGALAQVGRAERFKLVRGLHVAHLAHVVGLPARRAGPAEKDVARRLQESLAFDYALSGVRRGAVAQMRLKHRCARFLALQE